MWTGQKTIGAILREGIMQIPTGDTLVVPARCRGGRGASRGGEHSFRILLLLSREPPERSAAAEAQGRGWGRSVVKAVVVSLVNSGITPLYSVSDDNERSYDLALDVGFVDTGAREFMAQALRNGPEQADYSPSS